ncbi:MAG: hypothetical protein AMJ84_07185 [Acidithiobacillales bacterium SM23_46]|nr:MAG: hypothetical protein AMJ84_07185 [Acidithiobacillales bacterium SM23_46]KPL27467.1 MAG: hypothetical protein AMJ72_08765 [Acidithiobacillales bacterium SM1_46]
MAAKRHIALFGLVLALTGGCAPIAEQPVAPARDRPAGFPDAFYLAARERGEPVYRIDTARSIAVIRVYRGGRLSGLGHDHVVASRDIHGFVLLPADFQKGRADLYVPLDSMSVDEPALRAEAGFQTQPSAIDIENTRRNMLDKTLETVRYPFVTLRLTPRPGRLPAVSVNADITLRGNTRTQVVPVEVEVSANSLRISGQFGLHQSEYGIAPFSVLGGALQVEDRVDIRFELYATPL